MNMNITKHKEEYVVEKDGEQLAKIETYRNPYHLSNCYINFDSDSIVGIGDTNIFQIIADEEKRPLQAMLSSLETQKAIFLASQGFKKVRICHEMEVKKKDLLSTLPSQESDISKANRGQDEYKDCCELLFKYYKDTHEPINPLSSTFDVFIELMPAEVFYARGEYYDAADPLFRCVLIHQFRGHGTIVPTPGPLLDRSMTCPPILVPVRELVEI